MTLRLNQTNDPDTVYLVSEEEAVTLIRSRLVNYEGPYLAVIGEEEETFEDCGAAVQRAVEAQHEGASTSVYSKSKPSARWDITSAAITKSAEETIAQLDDEDELMPVDTKA